MRRSFHRRGQALLLMALLLLIVVAMGMMTLSIQSRIRERLELQNVADAAAYTNAVATARALNTLSLTNRTIVSHWVAMLAIQANHAWGSTVPAHMETFAEALNDELGKNQCPRAADENKRKQELRTARDAFRHAAMSLWNGNNAGGDDVSIPQCGVTQSCIKRFRPGFGQLDQQVADQARDVWLSVRDVVAVQEDVVRRLQGKLEQQELARDVVRASLGTGGLGPYTVEQATGMLAGTGLPDRVAAWREVSNTIGTDRSALMPLAHAIMGSKSQQFALSGGLMRGNDNYRPTAPRSRLYAGRIQRLMNQLYGDKTFKFVPKSGLLATFMDQGGDYDDWGDGDIDDLYEAAEEIDEGISGDEEDEEIAESAPPADPPPFYDVNDARRISPNRSIGWQSASGRVVGSVRVGYRSPCGKVGITVQLISQTRVHTQGPNNVSQHEWLSLKKRELVWQDGATTMKMDADKIHGAINQSHGLERQNHRPPAWQGNCHPGRHRHWGELPDSAHTLWPRETNNLGVAPGGFGFVFPQNGPDPVTGLDREGAGGAFGQPKLPVLISRSANVGAQDPWNLTINFSWRSGSQTQLDLKKANARDKMAALATGIAYYHRRCPSHQDPGRGNSNWSADGTRASCRSWNESPNMLNPYWRATLVPIDIDEHRRNDAKTPDKTPSVRGARDAPRMFDNSGLDDARDLYRLLRARGYEGIQ